MKEIRSNGPKWTDNNSIPKHFLAKKNLLWLAVMSKNRIKMNLMMFNSLRLCSQKCLYISLSFYFIHGFHIFHVSLRIFPSGPDGRKRHDVHRIERHRWNKVNRFLGYFWSYILVSYKHKHVSSKKVFCYWHMEWHQV